MIDYKKNFSKTLKKFRKDNNLTQEQFADKLNYSERTVSKWEQCESFPTIDTLLELREFIGLSIDSMLGIESVIKACFSYMYHHCGIEEDYIKTSIKTMPKEEYVFDLVRDTFAKLGKLIVSQTMKDEKSKELGYSLTNEEDGDFWFSINNSKVVDYLKQRKYLVEKNKGLFLPSGILKKESIEYYEFSLLENMDTLQSVIKGIEYHDACEREFEEQNVLDLTLPEGVDNEYEDDELSDYKDILKTYKEEYKTLLEYYKIYL